MLAIGFWHSKGLCSILSVTNWTFDYSIWEGPAYKERRNSESPLIGNVASFKGQIKHFSSVLIYVYVHVFVEIHAYIYSSLFLTILAKILAKKKKLPFFPPCKKRIFPTYHPFISPPFPNPFFGTPKKTRSRAQETDEKFLTGENVAGFMCDLHGLVAKKNSYTENPSLVLGGSSQDL